MKHIKLFDRFILTESNNDYYSAAYVTEHIWNLLDHEDYENDWGFNDYYKTIKNIGKKWELIDIDPNELKFNEDFDDYKVEEYEEMIDDGVELEPIVVDINNEIVDGNHRAKASLNKGKMIIGYKPIKQKN
jgi:hypothetical protein